MQVYVFEYMYSNASTLSGDTIDRYQKELQSKVKSAVGT